MVDTGQDIEVPDEMTIAEAEALQEETQGRFNWKFSANALYIEVRYRNYYKTTSGNRSKDATGAWKLLPIVRKAVKIR